MVAPIALYPDALLAQVLMAATYPLEIIEADRWSKQNKGLKGDALNAAVDKQSWDTSVKSLASFPQVLGMMSDKIEWTQKLGDAFLAQQKDVMATVQKLRAKAHAAGNLKTNSEQKVVVQEQIIEIVPANPAVVYVPAYNPTVVYGAWWYPAYPPYPVYPPGAMAATSIMSFGLGVAVGAAWSNNWGSCNWHTGDVNVNVNKSVNINNTHINNFNNNNFNKWQHDPDHRRGVAYHDNAMAQKYGQTQRGGADQRQQYRGFDGNARGDSAKAANRQGANTTAANRQTSHQPTRAAAFDGMDRGGRQAMNSSERGRTSRESMGSYGGHSGFGSSGRSERSFSGGRRR